MSCRARQADRRACGSRPRLEIVASCRSLLCYCTAVHAELESSRPAAVGKSCLLNIPRPRHPTYALSQARASPRVRLGSARPVRSSTTAQHTNPPSSSTTTTTLPPGIRILLRRPTVTRVVDRGSSRTKERQSSRPRRLAYSFLGRGAHVSGGLSSIHSPSGVAASTSVALTQTTILDTHVNAQPTTLPCLWYCANHHTIISASRYCHCAATFTDFAQHREATPITTRRAGATATHCPRPCSAPSPSHRLRRIQNTIPPVHSTARHHLRQRRLADPGQYGPPHRRQTARRCQADLLRRQRIIPQSFAGIEWPDQPCYSAPRIWRRH